MANGDGHTCHEPLRSPLKQVWVGHQGVGRPSARADTNSVVKYFFVNEWLVVVAVLLMGAPVAAAQHEMSHGMQMGGAKTFIADIEAHDSSGTSSQPNSTDIPMLMTTRGNWMLMFHANAFVVDTQQTSPRGGDKSFSTNWFMPMAQRVLGSGRLTLRGMFSLEPGTVTERRFRIAPQPWRIRSRRSDTIRRIRRTSPMM